VQQGRRGLLAPLGDLRKRRRRRSQSTCTLGPGSPGSPYYLSVPVPVLALLADPVDGVEVLVGAQAGQRGLQRGHGVAGAVQTAGPPAAALLVLTWGGEREREKEKERERETSSPHCFPGCSFFIYFVHRVFSVTKYCR